MTKQPADRPVQKDEHFETLANASVDGLLVIDSDGIVQYANPSAKAMFAGQTENLVGFHFGMPAISESTELQLPRKGEVRYVEMRATDFYWDGRKATLASLRDMTERKRAEEALRENEKKYRNLVEGLNDAVYRMKLPEGRYEYFSSSAIDVFGYPCEEFVNNSLFIQSIIHPDYVGYFEEKWKELLDGNVQEKYEYKIIDSEGNERWIVQSSKGIFDDTGQIEPVEGLCQNITERKQAEEALRESEALLSRSQEIAHIGSWKLDLATKSLTWSDEVYRIFGCQPQEFAVTYETFLDFVHPDDRDAVDEAYSRSHREDKDHYEIEHRIVRRDSDEVRYVAERCVHERDEGGSIIQSTGMVQDITERKSLENQLRQAQKMESVGRLAGGVAHDFNNLLMGIMNYADMCRDGIDEDHPIREWLGEITKEARRSADLTRQLLAFARKQTIAPKIVELNDGVAAMLKMLRRLIGEDIDLLWRPGANLQPVKMDPAQIDQILANLCVNARDAIEGVGKITIETEAAVLDREYCSARAEAKEGHFTVLAVSDNGCGMDRETLDMIFEPFFTTKPTGEGTGLGLATVYGIVKQNEGFVNVYSEPGEGTTFRVYLPVCAETAAQVSTSDAATPKKFHADSETVLVVEDEPSIRITLKRHLDKLGYTALTAAAPEEALSLAVELGDTIDLLITDVVMPGMSGRDLAGKLMPDHPDMKVLYISGYTANVIAHRGILEENVQFLAKPFGRAELVNKLREMLD